MKKDETSFGKCETCEEQLPAYRHLDGTIVCGRCKSVHQIEEGDEDIIFEEPITGEFDSDIYEEELTVENV